MSCCSYWLAYAEGKRIQTLPKLTNFSRRVVSFGAKHRPFPRSRRHAPLAPPWSPSVFCLLLFLVSLGISFGESKTVHTAQNCNRRELGVLQVRRSTNLRGSSCPHTSTRIKS